MNWPHDDTVSKNAFYGDFHSPGWQDLNLVHMNAPFVMYYDKQPMTHGILVHKLIVPPLTAVFADIWAQCGQDQAAVDQTDGGVTWIELNPSYPNTLDYVQSINGDMNNPYMVYANTGSSGSFSGQYIP